jgi:hypothetical protein
MFTMCCVGFFLDRSHDQLGDLRGVASISIISMGVENLLGHGIFTKLSMERGTQKV